MGTAPPPTAVGTACRLRALGWSTSPSEGATARNSLSPSAAATKSAAKSSIIVSSHPLCTTLASILPASPSRRGPAHTNSGEISPAMSRLHLGHGSNRSPCPSCGTSTQVWRRQDPDPKYLWSRALRYNTAHRYPRPQAALRENHCLPRRRRQSARPDPGDSPFCDNPHRAVKQDTSGPSEPDRPDSPRVPHRRRDQA